MKLNSCLSKSLVALISTVLYACQTDNPAAALQIAKTDRVNPWFGPQKHYEHVVKNEIGDITEVYRYYFDVKGNPILDGTRVIYRWKHDPGHTLLYRDGRVIREWDNIVKG